MLISISDGIVEMGHGAWADVLIGFSSTGMGRDENEAMSSDIVEVCPSREWCAGFGTVAVAFDGLGLVAFDLKNEGGKCLFL